MQKIKVAIVGVTGLVGQNVLEVIKEERLMDKVELELFSSEKSAGKRILFCGNEYKIKRLAEASALEKFDYAIFTAGAEVSKKWAKKFAKAGTVVIDNTSYFRKLKNIPLVVPEINKAKINKCDKIIANPNCSTIQLVVVLEKLLKLSEIDKVIVSTYQSVSGAGRRALADLMQGKNQVFEYGINDNIVACIGDIEKDGFSKEEKKLMFETNKILEKNIKIHATCVRVPISVCHGESVYVKFKNNICINDIYKALNAEYLCFFKSGLIYPTNVTKSNKTYIFRLRKVSKNEIAFFVLADNLRRGAAYNAVKILQHLIFQYLIHNNL